MKRRAFLAGLGGGAAWPVVARGQQAIPVIGYLHSASQEPYAAMMTAFRQGLGEASYVEGQNLRIEYRWAEGNFDRLPQMASELTDRNVRVLVTGGGDVAALAGQRATTSIPVVFAIGGDPVRYGLVSRLNRPNANLTGVTFFTITLGPKRLELLREFAPDARAFALLVNPASPDNDVAGVLGAARQLGLQARVLEARSELEIDTAFRAIGTDRPNGLVVVSNPLFTSQRQQIVALANHHRVPTIYPLREFVGAGGLMSYGASIISAYRQSGVLVGRILNGAKPADLPVEQPTKFELVINLKTAKALGLTVPPTLLARADEVIE